MQNKFIKDYLIETELGAGGMAVVYLAEHRLLQSKVAIKILNFEFVKNFVNAFYQKPEIWRVCPILTLSRLQT
jgi:serine/threonine protein kinase